MTANRHEKISPHGQPYSGKKRRLSDKIQCAFEQAARQGRNEIARRLRLIYEATIEQEAVSRVDRRRIRGSSDFDS